MIVNVYEAKTQLPALLDRAAAGEEIIIARRGKPLAVLGPLPTTVPRRTPGGWKGKVEIAPDFDAPLPQSITDAFYGGEHE